MVYAYFVRSEYCRARCAKYLVRHDYRSREVIGQLAGGDDLYLEVVLELVVEHAPEMLQRYIPRALKSSYRQVRLTAAAILALLDSSWSYSQLIDVLETSNDRDATIECRAALRESTTPAVRTVPVEWEKRHPDTNGGP